ncbi:methenyltetrahydromethanopterin cyclohydrolase [Allorhodopirellula solitaria]|uniref:Methenyltetrahydromethanopterin cyclohydrolase n=1 Tax=Allorhodopirellula solitaria TaxID=2527987 RepID=A0A5C5Y115_9BACT|nr:methenyltetrahydromethanopterin cyclohydrolase [Allorhodopirellula solitaria]TWT67282.1 Methenyltetrahydromethanopterin cyclohydrolase [Allorhodopirellula solitaria]
MNSENTAFALDRLHERSRDLFAESLARPADLRCSAHEIGGARVLDCGVDELGSLQLGLVLAKLCLGDHAEVGLAPAENDMVTDMAVTVSTDRPIAACLGGQYAGWPLSVDSFFAMASGPMRMLRGREEMLQQLGLNTPAEAHTHAVGVLESDRLPGADVIAEIADACGVPAERVCLGVASVTSIAGCVQVVSRSVETALHKLHALNFDVHTVVSATGIAPLPPGAKRGDSVGGIGRTNDAMLYGAKVTLWIDAPDAAIDAVADKIPSHSSSDYGQPFATLFQQYDYDFYKVDPMLFSPAVVTIHSLQSGRTWRSGKLAPDLLQASFGMDS